MLATLFLQDRFQLRDNLHTKILASLLHFFFCISPKFVTVDRSHTSPAILWSYIFQLKYMFYMLDVVLYICLSHFCGQYTEHKTVHFFSIAAKMWHVISVPCRSCGYKPHAFFCTQQAIKNQRWGTKLALETVTGYVLNYLVRVCSERILASALAFWQSNSS